MPTITTAIDVDAPRDAVWTVLTDLEAYPDWNPHVTSAEGELREGSTLELRVDRIGAKPQETTVNVPDVDPDRRLE